MIRLPPLPENTQSFLHETGEMSRFIGRFFVEGVRPRYEVGEFFHQCFAIGYIRVMSRPEIALQK